MARKFSLWGLITKPKKELSYNNLSLVNYFLWLKGLAVSMFEWQDLPPTVNARYLEEALFTDGKLLFFKDETKGFLALKCSAHSDVNVYGEPLKYFVNEYNYSNTVSAHESVLIRNNDLEYATQYQVAAFAHRLNNTERTIDINMNAQKTPVLILCDDKQLLTVKNIYAKYEGNTPVIIADKNVFTPESFRVLKTDAPYIIDKLDVHKMNLWNEALTYLGINNANTDKRERLIVDEVNANKEHVNMNAAFMLKAREKACEEINNMFGLNVSVRMRGVEELEAFTKNEYLGSEETEQ